MINDNQNVVEPVVNTDTQNEPEQGIERIVAVMMPFCGGDKINERRQALEFHRLKFNIEKRLQFQPEWLQGVKVRYKVVVFKAIVGEINEEAIDLITGADVLVGFITETNLNVVFEVGIRTLFRDAPILIIKGNANELLPIYLQGNAYINYADATLVDITNTIDEIAKDDEKYPKVGFSVEIPDLLKDKIKAHDEKMLERLSEAFKSVERIPPPPRSQHLLKLVRDLDPGRLLSQWKVYFPYTVLRIRWKRRSGGLEYNANDLLGTPVVYHANGDFLELIRFLDAQEIDPDGPDALTGERILSRLEGVMDENDHARFREDQNRLFEELILKNQLGDATVLLQLNEKHRKLAGRVYRLSLVAKRTVGRPEAIHTTYALVVYFDVTTY